jgi:predicted negative regulator of RcsB-dependent stress response
MNIQVILVFVIISTALCYIGWQVWRKVRALTTKNSADCEIGCGSCGSSKKTKTSSKFVKIQR